jgi:arylsulfatase A-like enzyme
VVRGRRDGIAPLLAHVATEPAAMPAREVAVGAAPLPAAPTAPQVRALFQRAGTTVAWPLRLGAEPYFAFTPLPGEAPCAIAATVSLLPGGGKPVVLWRGGPPRDPWPGMAEVTLDLAPWAEQSVALQLDVRRGAPGSVACAMLWGSPELLSREPLNGRGAPARATPPHPNIVLLGADTLRADAVGAWGRRPSVTPALDALAAESDVWLDAFSTVNSTNPSFASIHTGLYVHHHGVRDLASPLPEARVTLAERLADAGYDTCAVIAARHLDPDRSGLGQGFAAVAAADETAAARLAVDQAIDWLQRPRSRPFFLWVHLFDPHTPHLPPAPYALGERAARPYGLSPVRDWIPFRALGPRPFRDARLRGARDLYLGEVAYLDREVDRLLGLLRSRGLLADTLVAFVADHGENLEEHGITYRHAGLWDATTHVPLMVRWPQATPRPAGRRLRGLVQTLDLFPTLLGAAGLADDGSDGRDLRRLTGAGRHGRSAVFAEQSDGQGAAVRTAGWRYFVSTGSRLVADGPYLYDLSRDAGERRNLAGQGRRQERELRALLAQWLRGGTTAGQRGQLTAEQAAALRALGYD